MATDRGRSARKAVGAEVDAAIAELEAAEEEPYYDEAADESARELYYADLDASDGEPLRAALAELLERTHDPRPSYKPMQMGLPAGRPASRRPPSQHLLGQDLHRRGADSRRR